MTNELFNEALALWSEANPKASIHLPYVDCTHLHFVETENKELNLRENSEFYHSPKNALKESQKWFSEINLEGVEVLYVFGVGLGYAYDTAKNWLELSHKHTLIFLEDHLAVIHRLFETERGLKILQDPQVKILHFENCEEPHGTIAELYWQVLTTKMLISALPFYAQTRAQDLQELREGLTYECTLRHAILQEYLNHGAPYYRNFYKNIKFLPTSALGDALKDNFKNIPAIICGAGPSLNKHFELLKTLQDKALIFAGGSALNALNKAGVRPHLGAGIDPNPEQYVRMKANLSLDTPFVYRSRMDFNALSSVQGQRIYISGGGGYDTARWFEKKLEIPTEEIDEGFNVINFCLDIARLWGCNPIIFVGMDLAYTQLQAYASGVVAEASVDQKRITGHADLDDRAFLKKDIHGNPIYTLWKWVTESQWIGEFAKKHLDKSLINATEGGLGFPGVPNLSLESVIALHLNEKYELEDSLNKQIKQHMLSYVTVEKLDDLLDILRASLKRCEEHLNTLIDDLGERIITANKTQSGLAALAETELLEEEAYSAILNIFDAVYSKLQSSVRENSLSLHKQRYQFLLDVVKTHLLLLS